MATLTELLGEDQIQQVCLKELCVVKVEEDILPFFMIAASESRHRTQVKLACFSVYSEAYMQMTLRVILLTIHLGPR